MPIQQWSQRIWIVQLADEPHLSEELVNISERTKAAKAPVDVILDLSAVTHLNSSNLSQILRVRKVAIDRDTKLLLAALPDGLWPTFMTTGLDKVFHFVADVPTALATMQMAQ